jgi:hypothetical protein
MDVIAFDGRERLGRWLADHTEVIGECKQLAGYFPLGECTDRLSPRQDAAVVVLQGRSASSVGIAFSPPATSTHAVKQAALSRLYGYGDPVTSSRPHAHGGGPD